uniref:RPGR-interacting protein 1 first C2 domain-containing protein n=1 Tax=Panagrolaimus sp. PS1159 TaxID=55785 RepID=A0AC35G4K3_9BILA
MPIRPSVETWNRGELEDKFYRQYDQLIAVKKRNNELENKLRLSSSRIRQALESGNASETEERNRELERENRLLAQKLKALRHQLIAYTRPQAHNTTLNFLTSRSTGRPRSGVPAESGRPPQGQEEKGETHGTSDGTTTHVQRPAVDDRHVHIVTPNHSHITSEPIPATEEKQQIIKLYRENREKDEEIDELNSRLSKNVEKLETLRTEYDKVIQELENSNLRVNQLQKTINQKPQESIDLVEKELALLKQENKVLKAANDRFVHNSLIDSNSTKETSTELQALQKHVQEVEMKVTEIENENKQLTKKLKSAESEKKSISSKYKKLKEKIAKKEEQRKEQAASLLPLQTQKEEIEENESDEIASSVASSPIQRHKPPRQSKHRHSNNHHRTFEPSVLDRVFEDVASIVNSHISRTESSASLDNEFGANTKWRQMYESVYSELEKLRNLLMIQHRVAERQKKEILILNDSNESNKHEYEKKLGEFVLELNRRAKRIEILENQLRSIANGATDFDRSVLSQTSEKPFIDIPTTLSTTEMTLRLKKLTITETGLKHTSSIDPMLFLSLEFFDFELQTTPLIQGPEIVFEYSTVYDIVISNLFIHYIETVCFLI